MLAEDDKTTLVDGTMNANSATKPGMMPIKNLAKARGIRPQLPGCQSSERYELRENVAKLAATGSSPLAQSGKVISVLTGHHRKT